MENKYSDRKTPAISVGNCCGCGSCVAVCECGAVSLKVDSRGFYAPAIDNIKCVNCLDCLKVCGDNKKCPDTMICDEFNSILACSNNDNIKEQASSGGFVTQFIADLLSSGEIDGAVVVGISEKEPLKPRAILARTIGEVTKSAGSKYLPVPVNSILNQVDWATEKIAYVGLPCQIYRLRRFLEIRYGNNYVKPIVIGLLCNHLPSLNAGKYLLYLNKIKEERLKKIQFRNGVWPGNVAFHVKGDFEIDMPFMRAWSSGFGFFFYGDCCLKCNLFVSPEADINVGDPWGVNLGPMDRGSLVFFKEKLGSLLIRGNNISYLPLSMKEKVFVNRKISKKRCLFPRVSLKRLGRYRWQWPLIKNMSRLLVIKNRTFSIAKYYMRKLYFD